MRAFDVAIAKGSEAGRRMGAFMLAAVCGVFVPLSPLVAEYVVTGEVQAGSWSAVGVTYVAGVGLVSSNKDVLVLALVIASGLAFLYGVDMKDAYDHIRLHAVGAAQPHAVGAVKAMIGAASLEYGLERALRHLFGAEPFLEI